MAISEIAHCALVILAELANNYRCSGMSASQISQNNNIPLHTINEAVILLIDLDFIIYENTKLPVEHTSDSPLSVSRYPDDIYVADVLKEIDRKKFKGLFVDSVGVVLPQSKLTHCLNELRRRSEVSLDSQMRGLSVNVLGTWANTRTKIQYQQ